MFELHFDGRVQGRGSKQAMQDMRVQLSNFSGRDISAYKIVEI